MLPHIQLDDFENENDSGVHTRSLLLSDGNKIVRVDLNAIQSYLPTKFQNKQLSNLPMAFGYKNNFNASNPLNKIAHIECLQIFEHNRDVKAFRKKNNLLASFSK